MEIRKSIGLAILSVLLCSVAYCAEYQVKIYFDEIKLGITPAYSVNITFRDTSGKVVRTQKGIYSFPVLTGSSNLVCNSASVSNNQLPGNTGILIMCNDVKTSIPEYLKVKGESR